MGPTGWAVLILIVAPSLAQLAPEGQHLRQVGPGVFVVDGMAGKGSRSDRNVVAEAARGDNDAIARRLHDGWDVNARDPSGRSALHAAAAAGKLQTVQFLLAHGADVDARDEDGRTPLFSAAECDNPDIARLLLANGAKFPV